MAVTGVGKDMVRDARYFGLATRIAAELGAQFVKSYYVDEGFERIALGCPVPIVIAGGKKLPEREALQMAWQAIDQGAAGVDMGRNVFQSSNPVAMLAGARRDRPQGREGGQGLRHVPRPGAGQGSLTMVQPEANPEKSVLARQGRRRDRCGERHWPRDRARLVRRRALRSPSSTSTRRRSAKVAAGQGLPAGSLRRDRYSSRRPGVRERRGGHCGGLDILVSNAGSAQQGAIADLPMDELRRSFELNFFGHQNACQAAIRIFRRQGRRRYDPVQHLQPVGQSRQGFRPLRHPQGRDAGADEAICGGPWPRRHPRQRHQCRPHPQPG